MPQSHSYATRLVWTGAAAGPTQNYMSYSREFRAEFSGKPSLTGSADPAYRGDPKLHNPEDLLLASLAACHLLTYLALATRKKLVVVAYEDHATGTMVTEGGGGRFTDVLLKPVVTVAKGSDLALARALHEDAHKGCFIASSVNFPVRHEAEIIEAA